MDSARPKTALAHSARDATSGLQSVLLQTVQAITGVPIKPTAIPGPELLELREIRDPMGKVIELAPGVLGQPKPSKTLSPGRERQGVTGSDNGRQCTPYSVVCTHSVRAVIECAGIPPIDGTSQASTNVPRYLLST